MVFNSSMSPICRVESNYAALNMLKRTNVYSDVFKIWHDGPFGTISGLRLGRTSSQEVSWDEINAAWGHAVLLLHTMAKASCPSACETYFPLPIPMPYIVHGAMILDHFFLGCVKSAQF